VTQALEVSESAKRIPKKYFRMYGRETALVWPCTEEDAKHRAHPNIFPLCSAVKARQLDIGAGGLKMLLKIESSSSRWYVISSPVMSKARLPRVGARVVWSRPALKKERYVGVFLPFLSNDQRIRLARTINRMAVDRAGWGK
jgi:hypothetical protein